MDEQAFVGFLQKHFPFSRGLGIGDDTSIVKVGDTYQLISTDILIEGIHFSLDNFSMKELALKSLAVNLSDIAAMGGTPHYFYLGLGFPQKLTKKDLNDFYRGLKQGCRKWKVELAGGDFSRSSALFISITLVGQAEQPVYRSGAEQGDLIGITGATGASALGLKCLMSHIQHTYFIQKHKEVDPEIEKGQILAPYANAMIDVSDGLIIDLKRILTASHKGAEISFEKIPVSTEMTTLCRNHNFDLYELVLAGGEDYVLLFTLSPEREPALRARQMTYHIIGQVRETPQYLTVKHHGRTIRLKSPGYDHFKQHRP
jgi:thiamine-monophosphate kinase